MFYTYILKSKKDNKFYIGQTANLEARLTRHNLGKEKSTKHRIPFELIYYKGFDNRADAINFEEYLKSRKKRSFIEKLIAKKAGS